MASRKEVATKAQERQTINIEKRRTIARKYAVEIQGYTGCDSSFTETIADDIYKAMIEMEVSWRRAGIDRHAALRTRRMAQAIEIMKGSDCPFKCRHHKVISVDRCRIYLYTCTTCKAGYTWAKEIMRLMDDNKA